MGSGSQPLAILLLRITASDAPSRHRWAFYHQLGLGLGLRISVTIFTRMWVHIAMSPHPSWLPLHRSPVKLRLQVSITVRLIRVLLRVRTGVTFNGRRGGDVSRTSGSGSGSGSGSSCGIS